MRRLATAWLSSVVTLSILAGGASAAAPALRGVLPPGVPAHGHSQPSILADYDLWAFGSATDNPILAGRCEASPLDPMIWFLPVSLGGDELVECDVPAGAFLVLIAAGVECSNVEAPPWYGADEAALVECVNDDLPQITLARITIDGRTTNELSRDVVRGDVASFPADNLLSSSPAISIFEAYMVVLSPLSEGTHTLNGYAEFGSIDFAGGVTYTIHVH